MKAKLIGLGLIILVVANLIGFSFYSLVKNLAQSGLAEIGVIGENYQLIVIMILGIVILYIITKKTDILEILD